MASRIDEVRKEKATGVWWPKSSWRPPRPLLQGAAHDPRTRSQSASLIGVKNTLKGLRGGKRHGEYHNDHSHYAYGGSCCCRYRLRRVGTLTSTEHGGKRRSVTALCHTDMPTTCYRGTVVGDDAMHVADYIVNVQSVVPHNCAPVACRGHNSVTERRDRTSLP